MDWIQIPFHKKLSPGQAEYLATILLGLDRQLELVSDWLGSEEFAELQRMSQAQIDAYFKTSGIRGKIDELIKFNAANSEEFIQEFYRIGAELGYEDIEQVLSYTIADQEALFHLKEYNLGLIKNLNEELREGIRNVIFQAVSEGHGYQTTMRNLMELPLTTINNNISVRTRAEMIARTEEARAHNTGTLQAYANYGVELVDVNTSHDSLVCNICLEYEENNPYTLQQAMLLLPAHPNCRCYFTAHIPEPDELGSFDIGSLSIVDNPLVINLCPVST